MFRDYNSFSVTPESEREALIDLEFISRIRVGQKVNVRFRFLQNDGFVTSISRTFWNIDNKDNTLSFCDSTIRKTFNIIKLAEADMTNYPELSSDYKAAFSKVRRIIKLLCKASQGLENLQVTYTGYDRFISQLSHVVGEINSEIEPRLQRFFPEGDQEEPLSPDVAPSTPQSNNSQQYGNNPPRLLIPPPAQ
jgi:hypothetical protein